MTMNDPAYGCLECGVPTKSKTGICSEQCMRAYWGEEEDDGDPGPTDPGMDEDDYGPTMMDLAEVTMQRDYWRAEAKRLKDVLYMRTLER